jgi:uncharacterized protein (DUF1501 family)
MRVAFGDAPGERRFVVVLLRGGLDGLHAVQPYADPDFAALRGPLALPQPGQAGGLLDLGGRFGLHPAMPWLHALYASGEATILHAVAGPWRERSHFAAQDLLESGMSGRLSSGWLNRALSALPQTGRVRTGLAVGGGVPLLLRGAVPVATYAPPGRERAPEELFRRILSLHADNPGMEAALAEGLRTRGFAAETLGAADRADRETLSFPNLCLAAGRMLAARQGPRVAALEVGGWDTHVQQANTLTGALGTLDAGLARLREGLASDWSRTVVLVVTEFGRTARVNGSQGTDHGTGGVAFLAGGAVRGGRVVADWPGLSSDALFENRDLRPTLDLRRVAKGLLRDHLRLPEAALAEAFPGSADAPPLAGLVG